MDLDCPLAMLGGIVLVDGKLICRQLDRDIEIAAPPGLLRDLVDAFIRPLAGSGEGGQTLVPRTWIADAGQRWTRADLESFLAFLVREGILTPIHSMAQKLWSYARNPRRFGGPAAATRIATWVSEADARRRQAVDGIRLTTPARDSALCRLLTCRRSTRRFSGLPIPAAHLDLLAWSLCGVIAHSDGHRAGTTPSAGALYPLRFHFFNLIDLAELPAGIYDVTSDDTGTAIWRPKPGDTKLAYTAQGQPWLLEGAQGMFVITGRFKDSGRKYGPRALPYVLLEAGHSAQNLLLTAAECGLGAVELGGFNESPLSDALTLDDATVPLITVIVGQPEGFEVHERYANLHFEWVDTAASAYRPPFHTARARRGDDADWCWGRDRDPQLAYVKAAMEAEERAACAQPQGLLKSRMCDLPDAVDPRRIMAYSATQYRRKAFPYLPFNEDATYLWKQAQRTHDGKNVHVLADLVYFEEALMAHRIGTTETHAYTATNTSGVATHRSFQQALENGLLELIERDAFMRLWLGANIARYVAATDVAAETRVRVSALIETGLRVELRCLATAAGVAVAFCAVQSERRGFTRVATAAHYDWEVALDRALMELESQIPHSLGGESQPLSARQVTCAEDHGRFYADPRHFRSADHLLSVPVEPPETEVPPVHDLSGLLVRLRQLDIDVLTVDLSRNEVPGVHTVRVLAPGLIPIKFGYGNEPLGLAAARLLMRGQSRPTSLPHPFV